MADALQFTTNGAPRLTGNAAELLARAWPAGAREPLAVEQRAAPNIDWVARLGAAATETASPPKPLYLKAPDAKPQNAGQLARR
jgi:hypothetical protein